MTDKLIDHPLWQDTDVQQVLGVLRGRNDSRDVKFNLDMQEVVRQVTRDPITALLLERNVLCGKDLAAFVVFGYVDGDMVDREALGFAPDIRERVRFLSAPGSYEQVFQDTSGIVMKYFIAGHMLLYASDQFQAIMQPDESNQSGRALQREAAFTGTFELNHQIISGQAWKKAPGEFIQAYLDCVDQAVTRYPGKGLQMAVMHSTGLVRESMAAALAAQAAGPTTADERIGLLRQKTRAKFSFRK